MNTGRFLAPMDKFLDYLKVSSPDNRSTLRTFLSGASDTFQEECNRDLTLSKHVEFRTGDGSDNLQLDNYPIQSPEDLKIWLTEEREYIDDNLLTKDTDYILDEEIGKITLIDETFDENKNNIKVEYYAGFSKYIVDESNNILAIDEGSGSENTEVDTGKYNARELADKIETNLNDNSNLSNTYTVTYNRDTQKFVFSEDATFDIKSSNSIMLDLIGLDDEDKTGEKKYISDNRRTGMIQDIQNAVMMLAQKLYDLSKHGDGRLGIRSVNNGQGYDKKFMVDPLPPYVQRKINVYGKVL